MAAELRWILLALCVPVLAAIWWWTARRSRQGPGHSDVRYYAHTSIDPPQEPMQPVPPAESHAWGVPPFEPLSIHTADFDSPHMDTPMTAISAPVDATFDLGHPESMPAEPASSPAAPPVPAVAATPASRSPPASTSTLAAPVAAPATSAEPATPASATSADTFNRGETQHIVGLRVCAEADSRWVGRELMNALEAHGLAYGRYKVFHRKHTDGRTLFCAASPAVPGTFDAATMPQEEFRRVDLFAVLPGPADPRQTLEALLATADELAATLQGTVQDANGLPLSAERADALREDVARFHASLTMS